MNYILFDDNFCDHLLPLTFTRPASEVRVGILTIREKWERHVGDSFSFLTKNYLKKKFPLKQTEDNIYVNSRCLPSKELVEQINNLNLQSAIVVEDQVIAFRTNINIDEKIVNLQNNQVSKAFIDQLGFDQQKENASFVKHPWDIFRQNGIQITSDIALMNLKPQSLDDNSSNVLGEQLYMEEGAEVYAANINTIEGPVYLGKNTVVMEGTSIRGPFALCESSQVKMNAKIYGPTTIGPFSKVGGEINNSVIFGYSNKAHDGFLGNSVIGEWCNLGADSNNSNLKNNYAQVKMWDYVKKGMINSELQFCGLIMGDHSKCGINTMFNTGTVVGVSANIFGAGFPRNFIPSFSWGGAGGFITYQIGKALEVAEMVFERRNKDLDDVEKDILTEIFEITAENRPK